MQSEAYGQAFYNITTSEFGDIAIKLLSFWSYIFLIFDEFILAALCTEKLSQFLDLE